MDLAYLTGQRPSDILKISEHDIVDNALEIRQNKTDLKLRIGLSAKLLAVIQRIRNRKQEHKVYSTSLVVDECGEKLTASMLRSRFDAARLKARVAFQFRDLRAKAATDKADSSGDVRQAQRQLGHTTIGMTEHYIRERRGAKVEPTK